MRKNVLIVEDEAFIAFGIETDLHETEFEIVKSVASVDAALHTIENNRIDLVVLDGSLRGEPSSPVAEKLRTLNIPFLILTGYTSRQLGDWTENAPRVSKPYATEELLSAMRDLLKFSAE